MNEANPEDLRSSERIAATFTATIVDADNPQRIETRNVSAGGAFLIGARDIDMGQAIIVRLGLGNLLSSLEMNGHVRWVLPTIGDAEGGIGVEWSAESAALFHAQTRNQMLKKTPPKVDAPPAEAPPFRLLVADDSPVIRSLIEEGIAKLAKRKGLPPALVDQVADGGEAWKHLQNNPYDLVILDVQMPVLDGISILDRIRDDPTMQTTAVVVVSANGEGNRQAAMAAGCDLFLEKPIRLIDLLTTVEGLTR